MVGALFDTNILIDYLRGIEPARDEVERFDTRAISIITWIEVLVGTPPDFVPPTRDFLGTFTLIPVDEQVADAAIGLRQRHRLKLPDALIWASALTRGLLLVTRDHRDFPTDDPGIRIPYRL